MQQTTTVLSMTVETGRCPSYKADVQVEEGVTCHDVVEELVERLQLTGKRKGAWHLYESWRNIDRLLPPNEQLLPLCGVRDDIILTLRQRSGHRLLKRLSRKRRYGAHTRHNGSSSLLPSHPHKSTTLTQSQLHYLHWSTRRVLRHYRKRYSRILLGRLASCTPLWGPLDPSPSDLLQGELRTLRDSNLKLSLEIADLNIVSTRLRNQLNPLRQKAQSLSVRFDELQEEVRKKREEKERRGPRDMAQAQTELIRLRRELEMRNRLNTGQNSKMKAQKELLEEKKKLLAEKKQELERLKHHHMTSPDPHVTPEKQLEHSTHPSLQTPPPSPTKRETPKSSSATKKRHSRIFEAKTRQLVEEEGQAFKQQLHSQLKQSEAKKKLNFSSGSAEEDRELLKSSDLTTYSKSALDIQTEGPDVLRVPKVDEEWYISQSQDTQRRDGGGSGQAREETDYGGSDQSSWKPKRGGILKRSSEKGGGKSVRFTAEAIILDTALEGEMELLKQCIEQLGGHTLTSDKGATCLHNAVCSGNMDIVNYLVELQGMNVNAQDADGWTPLHCAVAYSNTDITCYLVEHGASLFLTTKDGDTPLKIGTEEYEIQQGGMATDGAEQGEESGCQATAECLHYLMDLHTNLGVANNGTVYALFSRHSTDPDDLSIIEGERLKIIDRGGRGEQWWLAENSDQKRGVVPCTFVGQYKQTGGSTL